MCYNKETRQDIASRVIKEILPDKLDGGVMFFNGETLRLEMFLPAKGEFKSLRAERLASISPITATFEAEDKYYFDRETRKVKRYKVRKEPSKKYRIKDDYAVDEKPGAFLKLIKNENDFEVSRIVVSMEEAGDMIF